MGLCLLQWLQCPPPPKSAPGREVGWLMSSGLGSILGRKGSLPTLPTLPPPQPPPPQQQSSPTQWRPPTEVVKNGLTCFALPLISRLLAGAGGRAGEGRTPPPGELLVSGHR